MSELSLLEQARLLYQGGKKYEARDLLARAVITDPRNPDLWFALSFCLEELKQKRDCLERVLLIDRNHPKAKPLLEDILRTEYEEAIRKTPSVQLEEQPSQQINEELSAQSVPVPSPDPTPLEIGPIPKTETSPIKLSDAKAGGYAFKEAHRIKRRGITLLIIMMLVYVTSTVILQYFHFLGIPTGLYFGSLAVMVILTLTGFYFLNKEANKKDRYLRGGLGEEVVGKILDNLNDDYAIVHDIQTGFGNIDHFIICKNGNIFVLETKSHRGSVTIQNNEILINEKRPEKNFLKQSLWNANLIRDEFSAILGFTPRVTPVLVFTNAFVPYLPIIQKVFILNKKYLLRFITASQPQKNALKLWQKKEALIEFLNQPRW